MVFSSFLEKYGEVIKLLEIMRTCELKLHKKVREYQKTDGELKKKGSTMEHRWSNLNLFELEILQ